MRNLTFTLLLVGSVIIAQQGPGPLLAQPFIHPHARPIFVPSPLPPTYEWRNLPEADNDLGLFWGGRQVGVWHYGGFYYVAVNALGEEEGPRQNDPPVEPPEAWRRRPEVLVANYGLDREKLDGQYGNSVNGRLTTKRHLLDALADRDEGKGGGGHIPDDSQKMRLTIIASAAEQAPVLKDLEASPAYGPWKDKLLVQAYDPSHWAVKGMGYFTEGHPTIYLQTAAGRVLHRQDNYEGGIEALVKAIRKADPSYDPSKDPDLRKDYGLSSLFASLGAWAQSIPVSTWILAGALFLVILFSRRHHQSPSSSSSY